MVQLSDVKWEEGDPLSQRAQHWSSSRDKGLLVLKPGSPGQTRQVGLPGGAELPADTRVRASCSEP